MACNSEDPDILTELAIQRSLDCPTPTGRETPVPHVKIKDANSNEFPQFDNEASPVSSPLRSEKDKEKTEIVNEKFVDEEHHEKLRAANKDIDVQSLEDETQKKVKIAHSLTMPGKQESHDMQKMENSAAEALITLAGQDNIIRHRSPGAVQPNIIRALQTMSAKYITDEPILKESEKIEMFSEIPTTDSEEESLEIRRLRFVQSCDLYVNTIELMF